MARSLFRGDEIAIERKDGRRTHGMFKREDERYVVVMGTVGDDTGKDILVPHANVLQIVVVARRTGE